MNEQALLSHPSENVSSLLQERIRDFVAFYEQHAYLAYNLALRITCEPDAAQRAVQRGFLSQAEQDPVGLMPATVEAALRERASEPDPGAAGSPDAQALLAAMSRLAPPERAGLALVDLAGASPEDAGEALRISPEHAAKLVDRARQAFADALGRSPADAEAAARDWMWAAPPGELWEEVYQRFHRLVDLQIRRGAAEPAQTLVLKGRAGNAPASSGRRRARRLDRELRRQAGRLRPAWRPRLVLPAFGLLAIAAVIAATQLTGDRSATDPAALEPAASAPVGAGAPAGPETDDDLKPRKPLTAALLDKLRLRELRQLRAYGRRQADASLPARQRRAAGRRITALERAARQRLRAQLRREEALRDREARTRARSQAPPPPASTSPPARRSPAPTQPAPRQSAPTTDGPPRNREEADRSCLLDEDTGQYICAN